MFDSSTGGSGSMSSSSSISSSVPGSSSFPSSGSEGSCPFGAVSNNVLIASFTD